MNGGDEEKTATENVTEARHLFPLGGIRYINNKWHENYVSESDLNLLEKPH